MTKLRCSGTQQTFSNEMLIQAIEKGDPLAASEFYRRYGKRVNSMVWSLLGGDSEHNDIVQTVFLGILQSLSSIRDPQKLSIWVDSVTYRVVFKELRQRKRQRVFPMEIESESFQETMQDNTSQWSITGVATMVYRILELFDPQDRMIFSLKYLNSFQIVEIAEICGLSRSTVKRRINKVRSAFEKYVREDFVLQTNLEGYRNVG
ncbi:MAG: sigma-70 family RNA polymerase sigma factor [Deltaproteobacteria bacterium]|nr:sigma-70 family RNA polymerase sigma factor [Deltaproteobacteria bacterium]